MTVPAVSVVIPTTRRHDLVQRALRSVFDQTMTDFEIIVVVDGPNPQTRTVLAAITDPRLRVLQNAAPLGPGAARNRGAAEAQGRWVAFLDDDDEWLPTKLERQITVAGPDVLVTCRTRVVTPRGGDVWPRRLYDPAMPIDEYLFDRRSLFRGEAYVATSSLLLDRALFERTGFPTDRHQEDTTLLLRVAKQAGGRIVMLPDTLMAFHTEEARDSLGGAYDWRVMLAWADAMGDLLTRRAYAGFCLIYLGSQAARRRDVAAIPTLLGRALGRGAPTALQIAMFAAFWALPMGLRQRVRAALRGRQPATPALTPGT